MTESIHNAVDLKGAVISPSSKVYKLIIYHEVDIDTLGVYLMMLLSGKVTGKTPIMQATTASMSELCDPDILCINCGTLSKSEGNFCNNGSFNASEQVLQETGIRNSGSLKDLVKYISSPDMEKGKTSLVQTNEEPDLYLKPLIKKMVKDVGKDDQMGEGVTILNDVIERKLDPFKPLPPDFKTTYSYKKLVEFKSLTKGTVTNLQDVTGSMVVPRKEVSKHEKWESGSSVTFKTGVNKLSQI